VTWRPRLPAGLFVDRDLAGPGTRHRLSFEDRLALLLEREKNDRAARRYRRLLGQARLRLEATCEDLNFRKARGLDRSVVLRLISCDWIRQGQSVLITGATGSGKSYLACALGVSSKDVGHPEIDETLEGCTSSDPGMPPGKIVVA
jgi:DNA replication protein DnaC